MEEVTSLLAVEQVDEKEKRVFFLAAAGRGGDEEVRSSLLL